MSNDTPTINIELKEYYNILQKGGKITRNKTSHIEKNPMSKNEETKEKPRLKKKKSIKKLKITKKKAKKKVNPVQSKYSLSNQSQNSISIHKSKGSSSKVKMKKRINIRESGESGLILDFEVVPYLCYEMSSNTISFELKEKVVLSKNIPLKKYKDRYILYTKKDSNEGFFIGIIEDIEIDEAKDLIKIVSKFNKSTKTLKTFNSVETPNTLINIDTSSYSINLIEFSFIKRSSYEYFDCNFILTDLRNKNEKEFIFENRFFKASFSLRNQKIIDRSEIFEFILLQDVRDQKFVSENKEVFNFCKQINSSLYDFMQKNHYKYVTSDFDKYELFECALKKEGKLKIFIFLKYFPKENAGLLRDLHGNLEWIHFNSHYMEEEKKENEENPVIINRNLKGIYFNILKGKAYKEQFEQLHYKSSFYRILKFSEISENPAKRIEPKIWQDTEDANSKKCSKCEKIVNLNEIKANHKINDRFVCSDCDPCINCYSSLFPESKIFCSTCSNCSHFDCLFDFIQSKEKFKDKVYKCDECYRCANCNVQIKRYDKPKINKKGVEYCTKCEKLYERKEYCPICDKIWKPDEFKMLECRCKMWVHQDCDRILNEDNFTRFNKKKTYLCPICRTKEKQKVFYEIVDKMKKHDKTNSFTILSQPDKKLKLSSKNLPERPLSFNVIQEICNSGFGYIEDPHLFERDIMLIFDNAFIFNMPNTKIYKQAEIMKSKCEEILNEENGKMLSVSIEYHLFEKIYTEKLGFNEILEILKTKFCDKIDENKLLHLRNKIEEYQLDLDLSFLMEKPINLIIEEIPNENLDENSFENNNDQVNKVDKDLSERQSEVELHQKDIDQQAHDEDQIMNINQDDSFTKSHKLNEIQENVDLENQSKSSDSSEKQENKDNLMELAKDESANPIEITGDVKVDEKDVNNLTRTRSKAKIIVKKNKIKLKKELLQVLSKSNNNFEANSDQSPQKIGNKMEISEFGLIARTLKDEENNIMMNYLLTNEGNIKNSIFYPMKAQEYLSQDFNDYLNFAYSSAVFKNELKRKKKKIQNLKDENEGNDKEKLAIGNTNKRKDSVEDMKLSKKRQRETSKGEANLKENNTKSKSVLLNEPNTSLKATIPKGQNSYYENSTKFKTEVDLFTENYNMKSIIPPPTIVSFSDPNLLLSSLCYICCSFDNPELMIMCSLCFEEYHTFCISNTENFTNNIEIVKSTKWKCQNCKFCEICQDNVRDNDLLYCDSCDRSIHTYCLELKLTQVPESSWKCLDCFKCVNCNTKRYYSEKLANILNDKKDYSLITRNFSYCYDCGLELFKCAFCDKCSKSDFKDYSKNYVFIKNKESLVNNINLSTDTSKTVIMIICEKCQKWSHLSCMSFQIDTLKEYFKTNDTFYCLDCYAKIYSSDFNQEIPYFRYLEILKKSYHSMAFSKLMLIILKNLTKDSNIKLHSKLLKSFIEDNFSRLMSDKHLNFFIEAIKQDCYLLGDRVFEKKKKKFTGTKNKLKNETSVISNEQQVIKQEDQGGNTDCSIFEKFLEKLQENSYQENSLLSKFQFYKKNNFDLNVEVAKSTNFTENKNFLNEYIQKAVFFEKIDKFEKLNEKDLKEIEELIIHNKTSKNPKKRLRFVHDRKLKMELELFLESKNKLISSNNDFRQNGISILNYYFTDWKSYFKPENKEYEKDLIKEVFQNFELFSKSNNAKKQFSQYWLDLTFSIIYTLKIEFLRWLLCKVKDNLNQSNPSNTINQYYEEILNINSLPFYLDFKDPFISENPYITSDLSIQDSRQDEEISKLMDAIDPMENEVTSKLTCEFCFRKGGRKYSGRLIPIVGEFWGHVNCIIWSKGVFEDSEGGLINVLLSLNKKNTVKCAFCKKNGATLNCELKKCSKYYHFPCSLIKQCCFTQKRQFFCSKCNLNKLNFINDFNTHKKYTIIRNTEWVHDLKFVEKSQKKLIPRYVVGAYNKLGNTSIIKMFNLNKENSFDSYDIVCLKTFIKSNEKNYYFLNINDNYSCLGNLDKIEQNKEFFLNTMKDLVRKDSVSTKIETISSFMNGLTTKNIVVHPNEINDRTIDELILNQIRIFTPYFDKFLKNNVFSVQDIELMKKINRLDYLVNFFNLNHLPMCVLLKKSGFYVNHYKEFASASQNKSYFESNDIGTSKTNKKEQKIKLENYLNLIKEKNKNPECFRTMDYLSTHKQMKISRKNEFETVNNKTNKKDSKNKQTYKNLEKTMNTNIMETDLPLAMKYRNYKDMKIKVTIGPSLIHRNGLMATGDFSPGEIVIEYCGELIKNHVADLREKVYNERGLSDCYLFRLDEDYIIDATKYGNLSRFINHCCDPNCSAQTNLILDKKHIILYAKKYISTGEEITYDYNFECEAEKIQCKCGAKNCLGRLN